MDLAAIGDRAVKLMRERKVHLEREKGGAYYHGQRTSKTALLLREKIIPGDDSKDEILTVAAWFHDIGKGIEPHNVYGAVLAREALSGLCEEPELSEICDIINNHCLRGLQEHNFSAWGMILQDADLLDHFGTFTIWMDFGYSFYKERSIEETTFFDADEWNAHCNHHMNLLNYDISKSIFKEKVEFINAFYSRFKIEGTGGIFSDNT